MPTALDDCKEIVISDDDAKKPGVEIVEENPKKQVGKPQIHHPGGMKAGALGHKKRDLLEHNVKTGTKRRKMDTIANMPPHQNKGLLSLEQGIHEANVLNHPVAKVNCMAYEPLTNKLCVGRDDGSLEIYVVTEDSICCVQRSVGREDFHPRRLVWAGPRLFVSSLSHQIVEWDVLQLVPKSLPTSSHGGVIWDMVAHPTADVLAVATEDGHPRLFDIGTDAVTLRGSLSSTIADRCVSVAFSTEEGARCLYAGSGRGYVGCWVWSTKKELWFHNVSNSPVWTLRQLDDRHLAVGTSMGSVHLLTVASGVQVSEFRTHSADILCMVAMPDLCFISGVDNRLVKLAKVGAHNSSRWEKSTQHATIHLNDVNAMCTVTMGRATRLFTGGSDGRILRINSFKSEGQEVFQNPVPCSVAALPDQPGIVLNLTHYQRRLDVWKIPADRRHGDTGPRCVLRYEVKGRSFIACSALSASADLIAFSTAVETHVLEADMPRIVKGRADATSLRFHPNSEEALRGLGACRCLQFSPSNPGAKTPGAATSLYAVTSENEVVVLECASGRVSKATPDGFASCPITMLAVDRSETHLCVGAYDGTIAAFRITGSGLQRHTRLARFTPLLSSITMLSGEQGATLLVTGLSQMSQNDVVLYYLDRPESGEFHWPWKPPKVVKKATPGQVLVGCHAHPKNPMVAVLYSGRLIFVHDFSRSSDRTAQQCLVVQRSGDFDGDVKDNAVVQVEAMSSERRASEFYRGARWLPDGSLWVTTYDFLDQPQAPALYRKKFAT